LDITEPAGSAVIEIIPQLSEVIPYNEEKLIVEIKGYEDSLFHKECNNNS
jgi:hypothetical protein